MPNLILSDPDYLVDYSTLLDLNKKIQKTRATLIKKPANGGYPFLFALTANKPHILKTHWYDVPVNTACTDGSAFYWNHEFLKRLSIHEVKLVMMHEIYHVILMHFIKKPGYNQKILSIACDYEVNSIIIMDAARYGLSSPFCYTNNIGKPISLDDYIAYLDGLKPFPKGKTIFGNKESYNLTSKKIYDKIYSHWIKSPMRCNNCNSLSLDPKTKEPKIEKPFDIHACQECGSIDDKQSSIDTHIFDRKKVKDILSDIEKAASFAEDISEDAIPYFLSDKISLQKSKKINFLDEIKNTCHNLSKKQGTKNSWKRPRRRLLYKNIYLPRRAEYFPTWIAIVDTSASMSVEDINFGLSQLQTLVPETNGYAVPCDEKVYWNKLISINDVCDIKNFQIFGRGLTLFDLFFKEYKDNINFEFDLVIIITDGFCPIIPKDLKPKQKVIWVITSDNKIFNPSFGKVTHLK